MGDVRRLHLGQVAERAELRRGDPDRLEPTTVATYEAAWAKVEELGGLDMPATEASARELLRQVPQGSRNAIGGALSAGLHAAGCGEAMPSRRYWAYHPPRGELDLEDYGRSAALAVEGLDRALQRRRRPDIVVACATVALTCTGARPRELAQTRKADLVREARGARLRLEAKGAKRWVPVVPALLEVLDLVPYPESGWLFPGRGLGGERPICPCSISHALGRLGAVSAQRLRRLYGSWLIEQGVPITVCAALMGHTSPETMLRHYARASAGSMVEAARMAAEAVGGELAPPPWKRARLDAAANGWATSFLEQRRKAG